MGQPRCFYHDPEHYGWKLPSSISVSSQDASSLRTGPSTQRSQPYQAPAVSAERMRGQSGAGDWTPFSVSCWSPSPIIPPQRYTGYVNIVTSPRTPLLLPAWNKVYACQVLCLKVFACTCVQTHTPNKMHKNEQTHFLMDIHTG